MNAARMVLIDGLICAIIETGWRCFYDWDNGSQGLGLCQRPDQGRRSGANRGFQEGRPPPNLERYLNRKYKAKGETDING